MSKKRSKRAKQVRKVLRRAQGVITPISSWTVRTEARTVERNSVAPDHPKAVAFCAIGSVGFAIASIYGSKFYQSNEGQELRADCVMALDRCAGFSPTSNTPMRASIVKLNDLGDGGRVFRKRSEWLDTHDSHTVPFDVQHELTHQAVLDAFDCAIEMAADELFSVQEEVQRTA